MAPMLAGEDLIDRRYGGDDGCARNRRHGRAAGIALEKIRDKGSTSLAGIALVAGKGWAVKVCASRGKGAIERKGPYGLTATGEQALADDDNARRASRASDRPRRR
jgi:hypothetical protein